MFFLLFSRTLLLTDILRKVIALNGRPIESDERSLPLEIFKLYLYFVQSSDVTKYRTL